MKQLLERIATTPGCRLMPTGGLPSVGPGHAIPDDLRVFYEACGGADLFNGKLFPVHISSPAELLPSNPIIVGQRVVDDRSDSWYIVASGGGGEYISIDLHPDRLGLCYDSFREVHGVVGSCAVVARSFTELINRFLDAEGGHWYWLEADFNSLGDAYDR